MAGACGGLCGGTACVSAAYMETMLKSLVLGVSHVSTVPQEILTKTKIHRQDLVSFTLYVFIFLRFRILKEPELK